MEFKIFVRGFGPGVDAAALEALFSNVGTVLNTSLQELSRNGVSHRVAFIQMSSAEEVQNCIHRFHGLKDSSDTLVVTEDRPHVPDPNFRAKIVLARKLKKAATLAPRTRSKHSRHQRSVSARPTRSKVEPI